jgi:copper chaperone
MTLRLEKGKSMRDIAIGISGMSCGHCQNAVNRAINSVPGVEVKNVRIGHADLRVQDDSTVARVKAAIEEAGYKVESIVRG